MWVFFFALCFYIRISAPHFVYNSKPIIPHEIAGIFENANSTLMLAFKESMSHSSEGEIKIQPIILQPARTDSYSMWREMCNNKDMRPIVVFGPQSPISDGAIRDQCYIANIPHIQATWQPLYPDLEVTEEEEDEEETNEIEGSEASTTNENEEEANAEEIIEEVQFKNITINFFPDADAICMVIAKLLKFYNWQSFSVLYEDDFGLMRVQKILANYTDKYPIAVRRLNPESDNTEIFKELNLYPDGRVLLDCHVSRITRYLDEAQKVGLVHDYEHFLFTSMDTMMVRDYLLELPSNSTWLSFSQYEPLDLASRVGKWNSASDQLDRQNVNQFEIEALIIDDIAKHVMEAMKHLEDVPQVPQEPICGENLTPWEFGAKLQNQMLNIRTIGITGNVEFDERGRRRNYALHINEISSKKLDTIGRWESDNGSSIIETRSNTEVTPLQSISKTFLLIPKKGKPYYSEKTTFEEGEDPNMKYEGFIVDLVEEIFKVLRKEGYNYKYKFLEPNDDYGKYEEKKKGWSGMIGDLLNKKADMAVCDFTITEERKKVIDFSVPFMSLGISILYVQERKIEPGWFSFLNPYTFDVWIYAATAYCAVSIVLLVCARISPADWENPEPCDKDPEELENIWTFKNCTWLTMGSIMTQGCDILPKAFGTRWVCAMWWFFAVIFCQSYIAQLSASMTSALENEPINDVEDLASHSKILYGAYRKGSTLDFFKTSKYKMYQHMYERMMANPAVLVGGNDEGERRVIRGNGKYAFFMESTALEYKLKRNCGLKKVGSELDSKDYGIAMPANSPFRSLINRAILSLKESTTLDVIKNKWWNEKDALDCEQTVKVDDVEGDLEMKNLVGLFIVLIVGLFFSLLVTAAEFFNEIRNIVVREQLTHKEAFIQELKASLNFFQLQKPVLRNPSRAPSVESTSTSSKKRLQREKLSVAIENFMEFEK